MQIVLYEVLNYSIATDTIALVELSGCVHSTQHQVLSALLLLQ